MDNNSNIKGLISDIIRHDEISNKTSKNSLMSARELLIAEKLRQQSKSTYVDIAIRELQRKLPNLVNIMFYKDIINCNDDSIMLWLIFNSGNSIMLEYSNHHISILNSVGMDYNIQRIILSKQKGIYINLARYGIENNFNVDPTIKTVSGKFKLRLYDNNFIVDNCYDILDDSAKKFRLFYQYDSIVKKGIKSEDGTFSLDTNVFGINRLFDSKGGTDKVKQLLMHLKVYKNDVPNYLRETK